MILGLETARSARCFFWGAKVISKSTKQADEQDSKQHGCDHADPVLFIADFPYNQDDGRARQDAAEGRQMRQAEMRSDRIDHDENSEEADDDDGDPVHSDGFPENGNGSERHDDGRAENNRIDLRQGKRREGVEAAKRIDAREQAANGDQRAISDMAAEAAAPERHKHERYKRESHLKQDNLENRDFPRQRLYKHVAGTE